MFRKPTRSSLYKGSKGEYAQRDVTVQRRPDKMFGLQIEGGIENDLVPRVAVIDSKARITGKLMPGDLILQVDGTLVAGEPHTVAEDLIKDAGESMRLTVCTPKDESSGRISTLVTIKAEMDAATAKLQDEVKKRMYDMAARFTTRPRTPTEQQSREFNFISESEFERLRAADRFIEASKADDGYWYGTIKPNKELAQPEQRIRRRQILEGSVEADVIAAATNGNGSETSRSLPEPAARATTAAVPSAPTVTEAEDEGPDENAQVQTIVLARKDGRLGFKFDGGIEFGVLLTIKAVDNIDVISSTNRGLQVGDCILAVNGVSVAGCTVEEAEDMLKGLPDPVELTTTCIPNSDYINLADFLKVKSTDTEAVRKAKEDVKRDVYSQTVPYTTRPARDGEVDGKKYNFVTREVFDKMKAEGRFLEWGEFDGVLYGTPKRTRAEHTSTFRRSQSSTYVRGKQIFRPSSVTVKRSPGQSLGMELISANGKTYIKDVDEASPAHAAKLRPGMLVTSIGDTSIADMEFEAVRDLMGKQADTFPVRVKYDPKGHEEALQFASSQPAAGSKPSSGGWMMTTAAAGAVVGVAAVAYQFLDIGAFF